MRHPPLNLNLIRECESAEALDPNTRDKLPRLDTLIAKYRHLLQSGNNVNNEWGDIPAYFSVDGTEMLKKKSDEKFWSYLKNFSEQYVFSNIASLTKLILTLPHSNVETEWIFFFNYGRFHDQET